MMPRWSGLTEFVGHRPWPLPRGPWVMTMSWVDLLFAHWSVEPQVVRQKLPAGLQLDTYEQRAWIGVVPFRMESVGPRGLEWLPDRLPGPRSFPELNVRTYVRHGDRPGVFFFSLDATSRSAVEAARRSFHLPYAMADITCRRRDGWLEYDCRRRDRRMAAGAWRGRYRASGGVLPRSQVDAFEHWLTERYCLYSSDGRGRLWCGEIHHVPWPLRRAEAQIEHNSIAAAHGLNLQDRVRGDGRRAEPVLHVAERVDVLAWAPRRVRSLGS